MKITTRGVALALLLTASPVAVVVAHAARENGWGMSAESRERLQDGKIAAAKATLKLTPEQEKLWAPIEEQVRATYKQRAEERAERKQRREERRAEREKAKEAAKDDKAGAQKGAEQTAEKRQRPNIAERYERMAERMSKRADNLKAFSQAFSPFFASLSDEQKAVIGPVMRDLRVAEGRRGGRWHDRGWGERWGGKHWGHGRHGEDGPRGGKGEPGDDAKEL